MKKLIAFVLFFYCSFCFSQEKTEEKKYKEIPSGYREISLGMGFEEVKAALKEDSTFGFKGERDISLLPTQNRILIETSGALHIKRAWFQFYEEKLYVIIIQMDTDKIDYYSVYSALTEKYGEPALLDPKRSIWKNENVSLTLERPLTVKYIDLKVFNELLEKSKTDKNFNNIMREDFINDF